jgi:hypothetical protein
MAAANTTRRRRHISFPGVVIPLSLAAMAILSLVGVILGTRFAAQSSNDATYNMPANFHSNGLSSSSNDVEATDDIRNDLGDGRDHRDETEPSRRNSRSDTSPLLKFPRVKVVEGESDWFLRRKSDGQKRVIEMSKEELEAQQRLLDSDDFDYRDPLYEGECLSWKEKVI